MVEFNNLISYFPKLGDSFSWIVEKITSFFAGVIGIEIIPFQAKLISIIILSFLAYLFIAVINFGTELMKKVLKWGLVIIIIIFILSVLSSIFI